MSKIKIITVLLIFHFFLSYITGIFTSLATRQIIITDNNLDKEIHASVFDVFSKYFVLHFLALYIVLIALFYMQYKTETKNNIVEL